MILRETINHLGTPVEMCTTEGVWMDALAALAQGKPMSYVRMSDGEEKIYQHSKMRPPGAPMLQFEEEWRKRFGCDGITCGEMKFRLDYAAINCTHFAPDGGEEFFLKHWPKRALFSEIYFPHRMTRTMRIELLKAAGTVAVVNRQPHIAARLIGSPYCPLQDWQKLQTYFGYLPDWRAADAVVRDLSHSSAALVLVSAGPAGKYIIPRIAAEQNKVVLDMGSGAPHFWCTREKQECDSPKHCGAVAKEQ